jgi:co-chaperonin GroES (HSP10)
MAIKVNKIRALRDHIIVSEMNFKERLTTSGIYIPSDDMKSTGIRPRWAQVYAIGPEQKDISIGQWICVAHGRWTRGVKIEEPSGNELTIRRVDNNDVLLVSDEQPQDDTLAV